MRQANTNDLQVDVKVSFATSSDSTTPAYTFGTLVTNRDQYAALRSSMQSGGFSAEDCEYLYIDNTGATQVDAFRGLNALLNAAKGQYVVLCHQDIHLLDDNRKCLDQRLDDLTRHDPTWAIAGNAGGIGPGSLALRITDPHGRNQSVGNFPERVVSLDENFLIVRRDARVGFSHDLTGFHFYGADICLHAEQMGRSAYVIDFHLEHLSPGRKSRDFEIAEDAFRSKWSAAMRPRWIQTTCALVHLTGSPSRSEVGKVIDWPLKRVLRRLPRLRRWSLQSPKQV